MYIIIGKEEGAKYENFELIKILRAQLSDSEVVMMRYNAQTRMGKPFQTYANRFNLLNIFRHWICWNISSIGKF